MTTSAERTDHWQLVKTYLEMYVPVEDVQIQLFNYLDGDSPHPLLVSGAAGAGKSTLLSWLYRTCRERCDLVMIHFVGAFPLVASVDPILRMCCADIRSAFGVKSASYGKRRSLVAEFLALIRKVPSEKTAALIIDDLDLLTRDDSAGQILWLPRQLPPNVKLIFSSTSVCNSLSAKDIKAASAVKRLRRICAGGEVGLAPLSTENQRRIIQKFLFLNERELSQSQNDELLRHSAIANPLFLKVALQELTSRPLQQNLWTLPASQVNSDESVVAILVETIDCWESTFGLDLVRVVLTSVTASRCGLSLAELSELAVEALAAESRREVEAAVQAMRPYMIETNGLLSLTPRSFPQVVRRRYFKTAEQEQRSHAALADYFSRLPLWYFSQSEDYERPNRRKVDELPWCQIKAGLINELELVLCDPLFIEAKCIAHSVEALEEDYQLTRRALREELSGRLLENDRGVKVPGYVDRLVEYARQSNDARESHLGNSVQSGTPILPLPDPPRSIRPLTGKKLEVGLKDEIPLNALIDRFLVFSNFFSLHRDQLTAFSSRRGFCVQHMFNSENVGLIRRAAEHALRRMKSKAPVILRRQVCHDLEPGPEELFGLWWMNSVKLSADQRTAISSHWSKDMIRLWDAETGRLTRTLRVEGSRLTSITLTSDGLRIISSSSANAIYGYSKDYAVGVWDVETGEKMRGLEGHGAPVHAVAVTPDGRWALSGGDTQPKEITRGLRQQLEYEEPLRIWDLENGLCRQKIAAPTSVHELAVTPDGRIVITVENDFSYTNAKSARLRFWNFENGTLMSEVECPAAHITAICLSPDGGKIVFGSRDSLGERGAVDIYDLTTGQFSSVISEQDHKVSAIAMTPDGKHLVVGSGDSTIRVWDWQTRECLAVAIVPSGEPVFALQGSLVATGGRDGNGHGEEIIFFDMINLPRGAAIVTAVRKYRHDKGGWADQISAHCGWCGVEFVVSEMMIELIRKLSANLNSGQLTCSAPASSGSEDPRLSTTCEYCQEALRFNPFLVDRLH